MTRLTVIGLSFLVISMMFVGMSNAAIDPDTVVGIWLFDDGSGNTAEDASGNGNDGELIDSPEWVGGKFGDALEFDGGNYVEVPASASFSYDKGYSFAIWFKANNVNSQQGPIGQNGGGQYINFWMNSAQLRWENDAGQASYANALIEANQWYHAVGTYDFSTGLAKIYVNGQFDKEISFTSDKNFTAIPVIIGSYGVGSYPFNGTIDEVVIFNVALEEGDIKAIMTKGIERATGMTAVSPSGKLVTTWADIKQ